jgi:hypothetical protein
MSLFFLGRATGRACSKVNKGNPRQENVVMFANSVDSWSSGLGVVPEDLGTDSPDTGGGTYSFRGSRGFVSGGAASCKIPEAPGRIRRIDS